MSMRIGNIYHVLGYVEIVFVLSLLIAVVAGLVVYFIFIKKRKRDKLANRFLQILHDFLQFKTLILKTVIKVLYIITAIFLTVFGVLAIFAPNGGTVFVFSVIVGNILVRIGYEIIVMFISLVENTSAIRRAQESRNTATDGDGYYDPVESDLEISEDDFE
ncbi:MAG: hypothetical protein FWC95_06435 [Defluviitaleaceae bacterium]|nr:hypothetical protein [Defluviitaleaceae bacterium]